LFINLDCKIFEYEAVPKKEPKRVSVEVPQVSDKYIQTAIDGELARINNAPKGQGNDALNCAAMAIGQLDHTGKISKSEIKNSFIHAYMNRGGSHKDEHEASATFESGWNKGIAEPRELENKSAELRAIIEKAAKLDSVEYACQRDSISKKIGIGKTALDKLVKELQKAEIQTDDTFPGWIVEPWPEAVGGSELLDSIFSTIQNFVIADRESIEAASAWVVLSWLADYATVLPMAMITAPEKGCGKTVFLSVLEKLSCRPLQTSCITPSALFRSVDAWKPTLLIDEADTFCRDNEELRGILNSGHTRNSAYVIKTEEIGGERIPKKFNTWAPKAIAGIKLEQLNATLTSRSVIFPLRRKKANENVQNLRHCDSGIFETLKQKIYRWSLDNGEAFATLRPELPELQNRDGDNWEPLLAIGKLAGDEWYSRIKNAAIKITGTAEESPSLEYELLNDIKKAFQVKSVTRLSTVHLLDELLKDELAAWSTYNRGQPMKPRQLANRLKSYGISPKPLRINGVVHKGYELSDFADVFERYIFSDHDGKHRLQVTDSIESGINSGLFPVTDGDSVTVTPFQELHPENVNQNGIAALCNRVTDNSVDAEKNVPEWEEIEI
jgi:putative DNA primase/helicase